MALVLTLFFSFSALASPCEKYLNSEEYQRLTELGARLTVDPNLYVTSMLNTDVRTELSGAWNLGVLAVASSDFRPPIALKFSDAQYFSLDPSFKRKARLKKYMLVHRTLGYLHVAPQLRAVLEPDSAQRILQNPLVVNALFGRYGEKLQDELQGQWVGVAMDLLTSPHPLSRSVTPPIYWKSWCAEYVERALSEMIEIRRRVMEVGIELNDQQLVIDPDGHVSLIDMDPYIFDPDVAQSTNFDAEAKRLIEGWQQSTGQIFPQALRSRYMAELQKAHPVAARSVNEDEGEWRNREPIQCGKPQTP